MTPCLDCGREASAHPWEGTAGRDGLYPAGHGGGVEDWGCREYIDASKFSAREAARKESSNHMDAEYIAAALQVACPVCASSIGSLCPPSDVRYYKFGKEAKRRIHHDRLTAGLKRKTEIEKQQEESRALQSGLSVPCPDCGAKVGELCPENHAAYGLYWSEHRNRRIHEPRLHLGKVTYLLTNSPYPAIIKE